MLRSPAATDAHVDGPATATGAGRPVWVPSPSWPSALDPQHHSWPPERVPHVWSRKVLTLDQVVIPTRVGTGSEVVLSQSWVSAALVRPADGSR